MVDAPARSPPAGGAGEPTALLATKLHLPSVRPSFVPRPRLLEQLTNGVASDLTLVCAPAGFGKTALLADWVRHGQLPVAWLSLDDGDNDPARFWRYVAAALDRGGAGRGEQLAALLDPPPRSFEAVVTALVNELAAGRDPVVLVLDDYHVIEAPSVHESMELLLGHLPTRLRLVLASRSDPPLPLARLRGGGQLTELRAVDLRFTAEEATALLRQPGGPELPEAAVTALIARTEGWAAGLQLAALSLRGHADPAGFVASFSGSHRHVLDYLTEEVLDRQPDDLVRFLLETSILARLSGPLCDAVTGRDDGQAMLERIERANLFLVPLDEVRGWWRYHHLFADLLQARLRQERPERVPGLHRAAAAWCEDHGLADEAVRHALAAGDAAWAAGLVGRLAQALVERGDVATLRRWLAPLPPEEVSSRARLCLAQAMIALVGGRLDEVEGLLSQAERAYHAGEQAAPPAAGTPSGLANVPGMLAMLRAELAHRHGDADRTVQFARQGLGAAHEDDRYLRYILRWNLAVGMWLHGREEWGSTGALVVGRHLYDMTNAWGGRHPMDVTTVVLTHRPPRDRPAADENFVFVTQGIEAAVAKAKELAGDMNVVVNGGQIARQCLEAGLLDEVGIELIPVVLGGGTPLFADLGTTPAQFEGPIRVVEGTGVTHLRYRVKK